MDELLALRPLNAERTRGRERLDGLMREPDMLHVPAADREAIRAKITAQVDAGDWAAADAALAAGAEKARVHGDRHRQSVMASRFPSAQAVVEAIERDGRKLRLSDDGAIECEGPGDVGDAPLLALRYYADQVRDMLAARHRVVVLWAPPAAASAA